MKKKLILILIAASTSLVSCVRVIPGCMLTNAENYNPTANEDDGSCTFRGSAIFYHDQNTSQNLQFDGVTRLRLFVDGVYVDDMSANVGFATVPACGHQDAMTINNYFLGNSTYNVFTYEIVDQDGWYIATGTFEIAGNECTVIQYYY